MIKKIMLRSTPHLRYISLVIGTIQATIYLVILIKEVNEARQLKSRIKKFEKRKHA